MDPYRTKERHDGRNSRLDKDVSVISQLLLQATKTDKQVRYQPKESSTRESYTVKETPVSVGLGLHLYHKTRSKTLLETFSKLHLSISYENILSIKNDLINNAKKKVAQDGIYLPPGLSENKPLYFAIDNIDLKIDTPDGKGQLHGTTQVVFQEKDDTVTKRNEKFERGSVNTVDRNKPIYKTNYCPHPNPRNETYQPFSEMMSTKDVET